MRDHRAKSKGRKTSGQYMAMPYCVLEHENFIRLSNNARSLLFDIFHQYNGKNNGEFKAAWSYMKSKRGWKSSETLLYALQELLHYGFIIRTQVGGNNKCSLYAITWLQIDIADDVSIFNQYVEKKEVPNLYKESKSNYKRKQRKKKPDLARVNGSDDMKKVRIKPEKIKEIDLIIKRCSSEKEEAKKHLNGKNGGAQTIVSG